MEKVEIKTDICRVQIAGRKIECRLCEAMITGKQETVIKRRERDQNKKWAKWYLCDKCYLMGKEGK